MTASSISLDLDYLSLPLPYAEGAVKIGKPTALDPAELRLIQQAQAGDTDAFRLLMEASQAMIYTLCLRWLGSEADAKDACQDTFCKAWKALPAWQPKGRLSTWLYQIALNQCRDYTKSKAFRQRRVNIPIEENADRTPCPSASPDTTAAHRSDLDKLQRGLATLPEAARTVLILCGIDGLSFAEAGAIMRCSERAFGGRIYRARRQLLDWWEREP